MKLIDMTGQVYERLTVIEQAGRNKRGQALWRCACECGNECITTGVYLRSGHTKSCGCLCADKLRERRTTHGDSTSRLYRIWKDIIRRCEDPRRRGYADYGGRGIEICEEWKSYEMFREWALSHGYNESLSIDRINNDEGYCPANCQWTDDITQANNKRSNHLITVGNKTMTMAQWSRETSIPYSALQARIAAGWDVEDAVTTPLYHKRPKHTSTNEEASK